MKRSKKPSAMQSDEDASAQVDSLDRQIIRLLIKDGRMPYSKIARSLGVSVGTVRQRIRRLITEEIIYPSVGLNERKLGYGVRSVIRLQVDLSMVPTVAQKLASLDPVHNVATISGEYDLMVFVSFRSQDELTEFISGQIGIIDGIKRAEVSPLFKLTKVNLDKML